MIQKNISYPRRNRYIFLSHIYNLDIDGIIILENLPSLYRGYSGIILRRLG
jgi:hypothetical protein